MKIKVKHHTCVIELVPYKNTLQGQAGIKYDKQFVPFITHCHNDLEKCSFRTCNEV